MVLIVSVSVLIIAIPTILFTDDDASIDEVFLFIKRIRLLTIVIVAFLTLAISNPFTQPFEIYKKILIVRGIESDTTDKLIDNIRPSKPGEQINFNKYNLKSLIHNQKCIIGVCEKGIITNYFGFCYIEKSYEYLRNEIKRK